MDRTVREEVIHEGSRANGSLLSVPNCPVMLTVRLFGGEARASYEGALWRLNAPPKSILLLAMLAMRDAPVSRTWLAATLWPDAPHVVARSNLRRHLHRLVQTLPHSESPWVIAEGPHLRWNRAAGAWIDVCAFLAGVGDPERSLEALALYQSGFLEGHDDEWTFAQREHLRALFVDGCFAAAQEARRARRFGDTTAIVERILAADEWREDAVRLAMSVHYEAGDRASALSVFGSFAAKLRAEMNVDPMPETLALQEAILANEPLASQLAAPHETSAVQSGWQLPFFGRESELSVLRHAWHRTARGSGTTFFVTGESGIGKSRLIAEFATDVEAQGGRVLFGVTSQPETQPYQALLDALRRALPLLAECDVKLTWLSALRTVLPEVAVLLPDIAEMSALPHEQGRTRLFESLSQCFSALSRSRPLMIVLEDMHWAHNAGVDALLAIATRVTALPILLVVTYRPHDLAPGATLREAHRTLRRERRATSTALAPLTVANIAAIVAALPAMPPARDGLAERTHRYSSGNPLFVLQLLQSYLETRIEPGESAAVESLRGAILARLAVLETTTRAIAEVAATIGSPFRAETIAAAGGWRDDEVVDGIAMLAERAFIREAGPGAVDYVFSHALLESVLYDASPTEMRPSRHFRIARLLDRDDAEGHLERVASHWERAGVMERATRAYCAAARAAARVFARDAAQEYALRAASLATNDAERFEALQILAQTYFGTPQVRELMTCIDTLDALADGSSNDERYVVAELREKLAEQIADPAMRGTAVELMLTLARAAADPERIAGALDAAGSLAIVLGQADTARKRLNDALTVAQTTGDAQLIARVRAHLAKVLSFAGEYEAATAVLEEANSANSAPDDATRALFLTVEASIAINTEDPARSERIADELRAVAQKMGAIDMEARAELLAGAAATYRRSVSAARLAYGRGMELADRAGNRHLLGSAMANLAASENDVGHFAKASELIERGIVVARAVGYALGESYAFGMLAEIARERGQFADARTYVDRALALAEETKDPRLLTNLHVSHAAIAARFGEREASAAEFRSAIAARCAAGAPPSGLVEDFCEVVEAALCGGDDDLLNWGVMELRAFARNLPSQTRHPARVAAALVLAAEHDGNAEEAASWRRFGQRVLEDRLALFSEPADRAAYLAKPFVSVLRTSVPA